MSDYVFVCLSCLKPLAGERMVCSGRCYCAVVGKTRLNVLAVTLLKFGDISIASKAQS